MLDLNRLNRLATEYLAGWSEQYAKPRRNYWGRRTVLQLQYAQKLSECAGGRYDDLITDALALAWADFQDQGAVARAACERVESLLQPLASAAKAITLLCVGHAHIDMNWMWSYDETVSVTLDTFRTMLDLMAEYPDFTYAQSQASVYEIVAKHDPDMLAEIRQRVHEGRWEVTASTWVEADRNMPNAESMARHFLYTRRYLAELLQIDPASLDLDYEPDTFGHHQNVPEILADAGVKYYYHCRGSEGPILNRWQSPSGRSILVYREPLWYNWTMDGQCAMIAPAFCRDNGLNVALRVYGVGDHGGGPTRRDLESIIDMNAWPIFPTYKFGSYHEFFKAAAAVQAHLPVVTGEMNFIFDGCYTTQTRIKRGNRLGEANLFEAEAVSALAGLSLKKAYPSGDYQQAWRAILFNQFHDILPGSGTTDTREYALGQYQQAFALTNSQRTSALRALADALDTAPLALPEDISYSRAEGAGVGFPTASGGLTRYGRHAGRRRLFMVWNPLPFERTETCELTAWDWPGDPNRMTFTDEQGQALVHQLLAGGVHEYWGHLFQNVLVQVRVPACGYRVLVLDEEPLHRFIQAEPGPRIISEWNGVLENEHLRVVISEREGTIIGLTDKETNCDYADECSPLALFRLITEDPGRGMTAWVVGQYQNVLSLNQNIRFAGRQDGPLGQSISWKTGFGRDSEITVALSLLKGERQIRLDIKTRWQEIGSTAAGIPQLNILLPVSYTCSDYRYDIPMGTIDRTAHAFDVPASSYAQARNPAGRSLMLVSDSKYGFRGSPEGLSLTLIRSSFDPDPWPEIGEHQIRLAIALSDGDARQAGQIAQAFCHPFSVVAIRKAAAGILPLRQSLVELTDGDVQISSLKMAEDGRALVIRLFSLSDRETRADLHFWQPPLAADRTDLMEEPDRTGQPEPVVAGHHVQLSVKPYSLQTIRIVF